MGFQSVKAVYYLMNTLFEAVSPYIQDFKSNPVNPIQTDNHS